MEKKKREANNDIHTDAGDSLCMGEKKTSERGAALVHLYWGTGFP